MARSTAFNVGLAVCWLLLPMGLAFAGPTVGPNAAAPGTARNPAKLGGHVTFKEQAFERVPAKVSGHDVIGIGKKPVGPISGALRGGGRPPATVSRGAGAQGTRAEPAHPFTAAELIAAAPKRVQKVAQPEGGEAWMVVGRRAPNGRPLQPVPLEAYVKQLNQYEAWLNGYGLSLRDGALASGGPRPGPVRKDLGLKFQLRDMHTLKPRESVARPQVDLIPLPDPIQDRFGPVAHPWVRERIVRSAQAVSTDAVIFDATGVARPKLDTSAVAWRNEALSSINLKPVPVLTTPMSGCPAKACALVYNTHYTLSDFGQKVVDDYKQERDRKCDGLMTGFGCIGTMIIYVDSWRAILRNGSSDEALQFFLANYKTPCAIQAHPKLKNLFVLLYKKLEASETGPITGHVGPPAKSFFDGKLLFQMPYDKQCLLDYSGNSWFGASACMRYSTSNMYEKTAGFDIRNTAGTRVGFTVFGLDFDLVNGDAETHWKQGIAPDPKVVVTDPVTGSTLKPIDDTRFYQGPGATFMIGPVPLSISSRLQTTLSVGTPKGTFIQPPLAPNVQGQGVVGIDIGARAKASVGFDAGIDAYVVAAGVYGDLTLLDADVTGGIKSTIDPFNNKLRIERGLGFEVSSLKGELGAFAEIDVLLYSKRWEVEIVRFDGLTKSVPFAITPYEAFAVDPESIKPPKPACE